GTVNLTFVAGPVDAAQSEVTVPVGAAVQGDPLELHLYARDANRNPVSAAQLDKVNVAIAATGTGVTLTATPQGDDTDATGPYRKYSLVPDTASYATQAIRYNTVTVQVNGAKVGTEYHAAWSPDIVLDNGWPTSTYGNEARLIIEKCTTAMVVDKDANVYTQGPARKVDEKCGSDRATSLPVRVVATPTAQISPASASYTGDSRYASWTYNSANCYTKPGQGGKCGHGGYRASLLTDTNHFTISGGTALPNGDVLSLKPVTVAYSTDTADPSSPVGVNVQLGVLDGDDKGRTSPWVIRTLQIGAYESTVGGHETTIKFYSRYSYTVLSVDLTSEDAWFDRFTLSEYNYYVAAGNCLYTRGTHVAGGDPTIRYPSNYDGWFVGPMSGFYTDSNYSLIEKTGIRAISANMSELVLIAPRKGVTDNTNKAMCTATSYDSGILSDKDQNIVAPHYLKYRRY
ncbi:hypothetical protein, partial [Salmonella enterica]|uniref:hypothetical protein n=1 Tax=Salmonella enterica TaxID=28901 RepID=UPI0015872FE6